MNITINENTVSIVGACISFGSMVIALIGAIISNRNLKLQKKIYNESLPGFRMNEVLESYTIYDESQRVIKFMVYPLIINTSSKMLILEKIRLQLVGENNSIFLRPVISEKCINDGHNILGNCADTKWICFEISQDTYKFLKILSHNLIIEDAYKNTQTVSMTCLKEMVKESEKRV